MICTICGKEGAPDDFVRLPDTMLDKRLMCVECFRQALFAVAKETYEKRVFDYATEVEVDA
jgi:hypothetical protein